MSKTNQIKKPNNSWSNLKCWSVGLETGYITSCFYVENDDGSINFRHHGWSSAVCAMEYEADRQIVPYAYQSNTHMVFTNLTTMSNWLREQCEELTMKLNHYLNHLSIDNAYANFIQQASWPENFIVGLCPKFNDGIGCQLELSQVTNLNTEYIISQFKKKLGIESLDEFERVWVHIQFESYWNILRVGIKVSLSEYQTCIDNRPNLVDNARQAITKALSEHCPGLSYVSEFSTKYQYVFDEACVADLNVDSDIINAVCNSIKPKLAAANRPNKKQTVKGYLLNNHTYNNQKPYMKTFSLNLGSTQRNYVLRENVDLRVCIRPNNTVYIQAYLPAGSISAFENIVPQQSNVLDEYMAKNMDDMLQ